MLNKIKGAKMAPFFIHGSIYPRLPWPLMFPTSGGHFLHPWRSDGERGDLCPIAIALMNWQQSALAVSVKAGC